MSPFSLRFKVMIPLMAAFTVMSAAFLWSYRYMGEQQVQSSIKRMTNTFEDLIASEINATTGIMAASMSAMVRDQELVEKVRKGDVKSFYDYNLSAFNQFKSEHGISHFYVHGLDRVNVLRMHKPEHAGDLIERATLKEAERTGKFSIGVEQGPYGASVLRAVVPVIDGDKRVGYLELGRDFSDITLKIQKILGVRAFVLAEKVHVDRSLWEKQKQKFNYTTDWDFIPTHIVTASSVDAIPSELAKIEFKLEQKHAYLAGTVRESGGSALEVVVIPFYSLGDIATQIVLLWDPSEIRAAFNHLFFQTALICLLTALVLGFFFFQLLGRVDQLLHRQQSSIARSSRLSAVGELAGGVAHEVNTPLASITLLAEQIADEAEDISAERLVTLSEGIVETAHRVSKIVSGLKTLSQKSKHEQEQMINLKEAVEEVLALRSERIHELGVELRRSMDENAVIRARVVEILQVLLNLLDNALDAVENAKDKWIEIQVKTKGQNAVVRVIDSGEGIPGQNSQKIFEPFFTTKASGKGPGLGLSVCTNIIVSHGGELTLDPKSPPTCFTVKLKRTS